MDALPATPEQNAAFANGGQSNVIALDTAAVAMLAIPGFTVSDIWSGYTPPKYLVKRMLGPKQISLLFGESGHFKSVIAVDVGLCVATGREFHGVKTRKAGVVYICGEGHTGLRKRIRAWLLAHDYTSASEDQPLIYVTEAGADLIGNPLQLRATIEQARRMLGVEIGLVIIDTLAANFGQGDENHAGDMQAAVRSAREAAQEAATLILHHVGHTGEGKARERGSYALRATVDYRLRAVYDEPSKLVQLEFLRVKDYEEPQPITFSWRRVALEWRDEDDEELTSVVLDRSTDAIPSGAEERTGTSGLGNNQATVLKVLQRVYRTLHTNLREQGRDPAEAKALLEGLRGTVVGEKRMDVKRFREAVDGLVKRGLVRIESVHIFLTEGDAQ